MKLPSKPKSMKHLLRSLALSKTHGPMLFGIQRLPSPWPKAKARANKPLRAVLRNSLCRLTGKQPDPKQQRLPKNSDGSAEDLRWVFRLCSTVVTGTDTRMLNWRRLNHFNRITKKLIRINLSSLSQVLWLPHTIFQPMPETGNAHFAEKDCLSVTLRAYEPFLFDIIGKQIIPMKIPHVQQCTRTGKKTAVKIRTQNRPSQQVTRKKLPICQKTRC